MKNIFQVVLVLVMIIYLTGCGASLSSLLVGPGKVKATETETEVIFTGPVQTVGWDISSAYFLRTVLDKKSGRLADYVCATIGDEGGYADWERAGLESGPVVPVTFIERKIDTTQKAVVYKETIMIELPDKYLAYFKDRQFALEFHGGNSRRKTIAFHTEPINLQLETVQKYTPAQSPKEKK